MPKSKRSKVVSLTAVKAHTRVHKEALVDKIRECVAQYTHVFCFDYSNLRTRFLKELRSDRLEDSRIFLANNRIMAVALGRTEEESLQPNLFKLSSFLHGNVGLIFTNLPKSTLKEYIAQFVRDDFARAGNVLDEDVILPAGPLPTDVFPSSMLPQLQERGVSVKLDHGIIYVTEETLLSKAGVPLTPDASHLLKLFGMMTVQFRLKLTAHWTKGVARAITE